jgi:hypothetical protein
MRQIQKTTHLEIWPPSRLKNSHSSKRTRTHGNIRKLVSRTVGMDGEQVRASGVDTTQHECCADPTLVPNEHINEYTFRTRAKGRTGRAAV